MGNLILDSDASKKGGELFQPGSPRSEDRSKGINQELIMSSEDLKYE